MPPRLRGALVERLPLVVVALMLAIGIGLELARFGVLLWQPKLALVLLLALAFVRDARARPVEDGRR